MKRAFGLIYKEENGNTLGNAMSGKEEQKLIKKEEEKQKNIVIDELFLRGMESFSECRYETAKKFFERSHFPSSYVMLGFLYSKSGDIGPIDKNRMSYWFDKAKEYSTFFREQKPDSCILCFCAGMYFQFVEKNIDLSVKYMLLSADQGYSCAQNKLGYCFDSGEGVEKDLDKAVEYYQLSAEQGYSRAQNNLGLCFEQGEGVERDLMKAIEYYQLSADQGNSDAQCNLGYCYKNGIGVEKDLDKAIHYYQLSADRGNSTAQCYLGVCYENGEGVEPDIIKAMHLYRLSSDQGDQDCAERNITRIVKYLSQTILF